MKDNDYMNVSAILLERSTTWSTLPKIELAKNSNPQLTKYFYTNVSYMIDNGI